jgi:hypothetical protein
VSNPLAEAFWEHIIRVLIAGDVETRLWLDTGEEVGGFLWWCDVGDKDAGHWRARCLRVWEEGPALKNLLPPSAPAASSTSPPG